MDNPIREIRGKLGLSQDDLALVAGEWSPTISQVERGARKPTKRLLNALNKLGFDTEKVLAKHTEFVKQKRSEMFQELQAVS